jgi:transcriptional regulator with XRE-family HTH domain
VEPQREDTFGAALQLALLEAGRSQTWLALKLNSSPSQVSRWVNGKALPHIDTVRKIEELLETDLRDAFRRSLQAPESSRDYDLFVSAPFAELRNEEISAHRSDVAKVVDAAKTVVDKVYWLGMEVESLYELGAADLVTEANLEAFDKCRAYLYLQFAELVNPSGALVELGFALGRKIKTTMIIKRGLRTPYMFDGLGIVAAKLNFLPETHIYEVGDVDEAVRLVGRNGRQLLLPD